MNLWHLKEGSTPALPILQRSGGGITAADSNLTDLANLAGYTQGKMADPINVVDDFPWTVSPRNSRNDTPRIQLIEKRVKLNSTVTNLAYSAAASIDVIGSGATTVAGAGPLAGQLLSGLGNEALAEGVANSLNTAGQGLAEGLKEFQTTANELGGFQTFESPALKPYEGLYSLEDTGFSYYFPYLDDNYNKINNSFGQASEGFVAPLANKAAGLAQGLAGVANIVKPGTYIEKAKQFEMKDEGKTLSFTLPLLNTMSVDDISKNWQLIFGLIYQNTPGRVSKSIIDQPVLYEVHLPGVAYMPYAYISSLTVKFVGSRRQMAIEVPIESPGSSTASTSIETVIPDAYQIDISVTGLNPETRNFLYSNITKPKLTVNSASSVSPVTYETTAADSADTAGASTEGLPTRSLKKRKEDIASSSLLPSRAAGLPSRAISPILDNFL